MLHFFFVIHGIAGAAKLSPWCIANLMGEPSELALMGRACPSMAHSNTISVQHPAETTAVFAPDSNRWGFLPPLTDRNSNFFSLLAGFLP